MSKSGRNERHYSTERYRHRPQLNNLYQSIMRTRTNWERVAELNEILGPIIDKFGYYFGILKNARECSHPYCLCYSWEVKISLGFRDMKSIALRMRAAYDNGGDRTAIYNEIYA